MEESITQVTEKNVVVRDWSLRTQNAKRDSLKEGYIFDLLGHVTSNASQNHPDTLKRVNLFAFAIYELIVFPKVLGHIEVAVVDFFKKLRQGINPVPTIMAETFRSLSSYRRKEEGCFIGCAQLLNAWIFSHFWKNLRAEDITWREPWIRPSILLYKCGNQDWVPLLKLWGGVGYAPLMAQRQFASRQFIPATGGLA
ncbi:hypothetical protein Gotur_026697 [Gossypium turneri]